MTGNEHAQVRSLSQRVFRWSLKAYPRGYRERDAKGMEYAFTRQLREARDRGKLAVALFWLRTVLHTLLFGMCERVSSIWRGVSNANQGRTNAENRSWLEWARRLGQNVRHSLRTLWRSPIVAVAAILSLALGIGANAAIFSVIDQVLIRPLPVEEPERLVNLAAPGPKPGSNSSTRAGDSRLVFSYAMFRDLEEQQSSFTGIAAHRYFDVNLAYGSQTIDGQGMYVSGSYFQVLGVRPAFGRLLGPDDDLVIGEHFLAILSHDYWTNGLGGDPGVLEQTIVVNGIPMTIVGVTAPGFRGTTLGTNPDVFVPISMRGQLYRGFDGFGNRRSYWAYLFARLKPGVSIDHAHSEINTLYRRVINEIEVPLQTGMNEGTLERFRAKEIEVEAGKRGQSSLHGNVRLPFTLLFLITGVVLFIACANIANLLLAQGANRSTEMAVRGALGGSRFQLVTQLLTDSTVLYVLGGIASLVVIQWTLPIIAAILPGEAAAVLKLDLRISVVLFAAIVSVVAGLLFGMYPALHGTRPDLKTLISASSGQPSGSRAAGRFRSSLVTAQVGLSIALLIPAGTFMKSYLDVRGVDLGFGTENVLSFQISPELNGYEAEQSQVLFGRIEEELAAIPGVTGVSAGMIPLLSRSNWSTDISVEGFELGTGSDANASFNVIGTDYFNTLAMPFLAGREFLDSDVIGAPRVAIVNEEFTRKFGLGVRDVVGKWMSDRYRATDMDIQIVGLVGDTKYSDVKEQTPPLFFTPYRQNSQILHMTFYVRTALDPNAVMQQIPQAVKRLDAQLPVEDLKTLEQQVSENVTLDRIVSVLSASLAALATALAAIGLYGVLAFSVTSRTREIGLRMALGASRRHVQSMVLWQVSRMTILGAVPGIVAGLMLSRVARSLLYGEVGTEPMLTVSVVALIALVALSAGCVPALRASRSHPAEALRYE